MYISVIPGTFELRLMSAKPLHPIRPPLSTSLFSCMAIETHATRLSEHMAIAGIVLNGMPRRYFALGSSHTRDGRYVMTVHDCDAHNCVTNAADIGTSTVTSIDRHGTVVNIATRGNIVVVFKCGKAVVLVDRKPAGHIDVKCRERWVSDWYICDRWSQQLNDDIYVIDNSDRLIRISWQDVTAHRYASLAVVDSRVEDFYVHDQGNAILKTTGTLVLNSVSRSVNMQAVYAGVKWSTVIKAANRWLVCGDKTDMTSAIVSLDDRGVIISSVSIRTTAVYGQAFIKYLKTAVVRQHQAIILAIDVDACCHLISMTASGHLHTLESMPTIRRPDIQYPNESYKQISSMAETDTEGQYIVAGYMWIKKLTVRLN